MTTPKLKRLIKLAGELISIYLESHDPTDCDFNICPFYDDSEKDTEVVTITFPGWELDWEFLEPMAEKLISSDASWSLGREEGFSINLYY